MRTFGYRLGCIGLLLVVALTWSCGGASRNRSVGEMRPNHDLDAGLSSATGPRVAVFQTIDVEIGALDVGTDAEARALDRVMWVLRCHPRFERLRIVVRAYPRLPDDADASERRVTRLANRVRRLLIERGAPASRLRAFGLGVILGEPEEEPTPPWDLVRFDILAVPTGPPGRPLSQHPCAAAGERRAGASTSALDAGRPSH